MFGLALRTLRHRQDAEDATQAVWERALHGLRRFRAGGVARHVAVQDHDERLFDAPPRFRARRHPVSPADHDDDLLAGIVDERTAYPERHAHGSEARREIERALGELEPAARAAILLREFEGLRYEEIADVLDIPLNTVKTRIHRARLELQAKLKAFRP